MRPDSGEARGMCEDATVRRALTLAGLLLACNDKQAATQVALTDAGIVAPLDAGPVVSCADLHTGICNLTKSPGAIRALTADATHVYWLARIGDPVAFPDVGAPTVLAVLRDGSAPPSTIATLTDEGGSAIVADGAFLYVSTNSVVWRLHKDGSSVDVILHEATTSLAIDGPDLYCTTTEPYLYGPPPLDAAGAQSVLKLSLLDGTRTVLATEQRGPGAVTVDGTYVYWASNRYNYVGNTGRVLRVAKSGGAIETVASRDEAVSGIAVTRTSTYFTMIGTSGVDTPNIDGALMRVAPAGLPELLLSALAAPCGVVADERTAYVRECRYGMVAGGRIWSFSAAETPTVSQVGSFASAAFLGPMFMDRSDLIFANDPDILVLRR